MKKIGFVDYFLDEWHANNYPAWIRDNCAANGRDIELAYAWADIDKAGGISTEAWCSKYGMQMLSSLEEVVEKSDCIIVLSPDNPEHHERLSCSPLMSGKPVYVDKTFSPDLKTGIRMFELAEKFNTPMFSSSALRFSKELAGYPNGTVNRDTLEYVATTGPGSYENYSIHQLEMIVSLTGPGAKRIKSLSSDHCRHLVLDYENGKRASMTQIPELPFQVAMQLKDGSGVYIGSCSEIFDRLIHTMLDFFETGSTPVPKAETLEIMAIIEAGCQALKKDDMWITVNSI